MFGSAMEEESFQLKSAPDLLAIKETLRRYRCPAEGASLNAEYLRERDSYLWSLQISPSDVLNDWTVVISFAMVVTSNLFSEPPPAKLDDHIRGNVLPMSATITGVLWSSHCDSQLFMGFSDKHFVGSLVKFATGILLPASTKFLWIVRMTVNRLVAERKDEKLAEYARNIVDNCHYIGEMLLREHSEHVVDAVEIFRMVMMHAPPELLAIQAENFVPVLSGECKNREIARNLLYEIIASINERVGKIKALQHLIETIDHEEGRYKGSNNDCLE